MPTTVRLNLAMHDENNFVTENLDDVYVTQGGQHTTISINSTGPAVKVPWPATSESALYIKFPRFTQDYDVVIQWDSSVQFGSFPLTIWNGTGFMPMVLPKAKQAADGTTYYTFQTSPAGIAENIVIPLFFF